jgi:hypothetical protein
MTEDKIAADAAASLIGVTPRRLQQLVADGWIVRTTPGEYTIANVVQGYIRFMKEGRRTSKGAAEKRVLEARAREIELRTSRAEQQLVPADEAVAYVRMITEAVMSQLESLPEQFTADQDKRRRLQAAIAGIREKVDEAVNRGPSSPSIEV